jgi:ADP-heptose:LPS heptosyltransferase
MKYTIIIDGGLGRQICAIPALEKFVDKNPDTIIVTHFWTSIFWGNPKLTDKVYDVNTKGLYKLIKDTKIFKPEPYYNNRYLNEEIHLIDAFNEEINGDQEKLSHPKIYLSDKEIKEARKYRGTRPLICLQPFGSTAKFENNDIIDGTARSLPKNLTLKLIETLHKKYDLVLFDDREISFIDRKKFIQTPPMDCRNWAALIANCNYFIGSDSAGQHIANSLNVPGLVFIGGTSAINTTYEGRLTVIKKSVQRKYMHYRLCDFDYWLAELENSNTLDFSENECKDITKNILTVIEDSIR